ncbi:DNA cytosine methyltransferase [Shewanella sp.]|uniref:DNA cytosine methyltransferase n=1 Tax=Shewanella sp. TaxID=50422 RepID=UPI003A9753ED
MAAYYNEIDPFAAEWLRQLIKHGHIADGIVDTRSIEDVRADEIKEFTQCHFFAGIGAWSYALRQSGWDDSRPIWTGSCPCQPFSSAGKGAGFDDERHLWPSFYWLIKQCRPRAVFGEQVASKDAERWLDLVQADMEALDYAFGAIAFPSACIGAPHIRDRTYWVADSERQQRQECVSGCGESDSKKGRGTTEQPTRLCSVGGMGNTERTGLERLSWGHQSKGRRQTSIRPSEPTSAVSRMADTSSDRLCERSESATIEERWQARPSIGRELPQRFKGYPVPDKFSATVYGSDGANGLPTNGFWRDVDWLLCRDAKWRPVRPGTFPLANGATNRVGRLRGYGNAINAEAAKAFITSFMECK